MKRRRASSLLEVLFALSMLAMLSIVFYLVLDMSVRSFQRAIVRHNIQADTQRVSYRLTEDLRRTHFFTVSTIQARSSLNNFQRDAICLAAIKDWSDPNAIDPANNRPKWNRYILYYCVRQQGDEPITSLYRCSLAPSNPTDIGQFAFPSLNPSVHCKPDPALVPECESFSKLTDLLESFTTTAVENSQWRITFRLRQPGAVRQGKRTIDEVQETTIQIRPENTFPMYN